MERQYRVNLLICAGTSCVSGGSLHVRDALVEEIEKNGLDEEVYVGITGCNGFCAAGPLMIAYPDEVFAPCGFFQGTPISLCSATCWPFSAILDNGLCRPIGAYAHKHLRVWRHQFHVKLLKQQRSNDRHFIVGKVHAGTLMQAAAK